MPPASFQATSLRSLADPDQHTNYGDIDSATLTGGGTVVSYDSLITSTGTGHGVVDVLGSDGTLLRSIDVGGTYDQEPVVAATADGGFAVAWRVTGPPSVLYTGDIYFARYDAAGNQVGGTTLVNALSDNDAPYGGPRTDAMPELTALANGTFAVVWAQGDANDNYTDVKLQLLSATGARIGGEVLANPNSAGAQGNPSVVSLGAAGFVVLWQDDNASANHDFDARGQRFDLSGNKVGAAFTANNIFTQSETNLHAAPVDGGGFVVVWQTDTLDVKGQLFDASGAKVGGTIAIATTGADELNPNVTGYPGGGFVVSWSERPTHDAPFNVYAQSYDAAGVAVGGAFKVDPTGTYSDDSSLTALANGSLRISFDNGGVETGIYAPAGTGTTSPDRTGTSSNDVMIGDDRDNVFYGSAGADQMLGYGGTDTANYAASATAVAASLVTGGTAGDAAGDSYSSIENLVGSAFDDTLTGTDGVNRLDGGDGNDLLRSGLGADVLVGGAGSDTVIYDDAIGTVFVNLTLARGYNNAAEGDTYSGIENAIGSNYADYLIGDDGVNRLDGGAGDDVLIGAKGADLLIGGAGSDTASYEDTQGTVFINLTLGHGYGNSAEGDTYQSIENVRGSNYDDFVIGDNGDNRLDGGGGNDTLIGSLGADQLIGGDGTDTASYEDNQGGVFVNLATGHGYNNAAEGDTYSGIENVRGGLYADTLIGDNNANRLEGGAGDDVLIGGLGADQLIGGDGSDWASYEDNQGAVNVNLATNTATGNAAQGDTFSGIENLRGTGYNDVLVGDGGDNMLAGSSGNDTLTGGAGADRFVFDSRLDRVGNVDHVTDFTAGSDKVLLDHAVFNLPTGSLGDNVFLAGSTATGGSNHIIYDQSTGTLFYDDDGNGTDPAVAFAVLDSKPALTSADFVVI